MYAEHQRAISSAGRAAPKAMQRVCEFALATIQVHLRDAAASIRSGERPAKVWFGYKWQGLDYLAAHAEAIYVDAEMTESDAEQMAVFMRVPGIGPAKAGFLCQMLYGRVGCLDGHNLRRLGLEQAYRNLLHNRRPFGKSRYRQIEAYIRACAAAGSPEQLWNGWCEYVAQREGDRAETISALHLCCIGE